MKKLLYIILFACVAVACNKDNYYQDSGIHAKKFDGTIMDYLDSKAINPIDPFDTLVQVIRYAGLEDVLKKEEVTFFAVPDPSLIKTINRLNQDLYSSGQDTISSFKEVKAEVWAYFLNQYIVRGNNGLIDIPQVDTTALYAFSGQLYQTLNVEEPLNVGVIYHDLDNDGVKIKYKGPRQILISYIPDFAQPKSNWNNVFISSSDISPINGKVHVINYNRHSFAFDPQRFVTMAKERGIDYLKD